MNRKNLKKLADYLLSDGLKADFDMQHFSLTYDELSQDCGSCGCAIGHGPYAGIAKKNTETWWVYSNRCLIDGNYYFREWTWCFDPEWISRDNTARGAGKRILWLLEHGLPENWDDQLYHNAPLCYEV